MCVAFNFDPDFIFVNRIEIIPQFPIRLYAGLNRLERGMHYASDQNE